MGGILKGAMGAWSFLISWVLPGTIFWSTFGLIVLPRLNNIPLFMDIAGMPKSDQGLILIGVSLLTGIILNALSAVLCRILEGYYLTKSWRKSWTHRQLNKRNKLRTRLTNLYREQEHREEDQELAEDAVGLDIIVGRLRERLARYPVDPRQMGPTVFANTLRAIETYGYNRYMLDSQILWSELFSVAPSGLSGEVEAAWTPIYFSVSMLYMSAFMVPTCLLTGFVGRDFTPSLVLLAVASAILVFAWYRLAIVNMRYLKSVVQAVVNVGRPALASSLNLELPKKLKDERDMWDRVGWFVESGTGGEDEPYVPPSDPGLWHELDNYRKEVDDERR